MSTVRIQLSLEEQNNPCVAVLRPAPCTIVRQMMEREESATTFRAHEKYIVPVREGEDVYEPVTEDLLEGREGKVL